jgi:SET domain-containing protein
MYKPLPEGLTIASSKIQGLGVFAQFFVPKGTNLGMSHMKFNDTLFRTPLGGFLNHSDRPNCEKVKLNFTNMDDPNRKFDYVKYNLITIEDINGGVELTVKYSFYSMKKNESKTDKKDSK